jgi:NAD dependent epimerase/dehydratase
VSDRGDQNTTLAGASVLVTGAGGFIGSHLVERLVRDGASVRALVRYNGRSDRGSLELVSPDVLDDVDVVFGDVRDPWFVRDTVRGTDVVLHLAASISIPYSYQAPADVFATNVDGTMNVLQAARDHGARVVNTSTSEVYGTAETTPIAETHRVHAQSPYAASKAASDQLALSFHLSYELPVTTVRPFNTYGPRQSTRALIPTIITQALAGDEVVLGALDPERDLTYVADTVDGFVRAAASERAVGNVVNLGSGRKSSVGELASLIIELVGTGAEVRQDPERLRPAASEVALLLADATAARDLLGWEPRTPLADGLRQTIDWIAANRDRYRPADYSV